MTSSSSSPLVAGRTDTTTPLAGTFLLEDGEALVEAIESKSWVAGGLAVVSGAFDAAAAISDPIGTLIGMGLGWVLDHIQPFTTWLEQLTGDADQVRAHAETWRNVQRQMTACADSMNGYVKTDLAEMSGQAISAYTGAANDVANAINGAGSWAGAMGAALDITAVIVQFVHDFVRDAIAEVVGSILSYAIELIVSVGTALPLVLEQIATRVASLLDGVSRNVTDLVTSARNLVTKLGDLKALFKALQDKLDDLFRGGTTDTPTPKSTDVIVPPGRPNPTQPQDATPTTSTPEPTTGTPEPTTGTPEPTTGTPEPTTGTPEPTSPRADSADGPSRTDGAGDSGEPTAKADDAKDPVPAAEGAPNSQRLADPNQKPDPDRPGYDVDGEPLVTERGDGRVHYANDAENTFRASDDSLQRATGGFAPEDSYRTSSREIDYPQTLPERHAVEVASENRDTWESTTKEWERVRDDTEAPIENAKKALRRAEALGIDTSPKTAEIQKSITAAMSQADDAKKTELSEISRQIDHGVVAQNAKVDASEWAGDTAGTLRDAQLERHSVLGDAAPTLEQHQHTPSGMFDRVSIDKNQQTLYLGENKGGDSPKLGTREIASGERAQQGSPEYCMDLLTGKNQDPRLMPALKELEEAGTHTDFFTALRGDGVEVVAEFVNARASGNIRAGQFDFNGLMKMRMENADGVDRIAVDFFREGS